MKSELYNAWEAVNNCRDMCDGDDAEPLPEYAVMADTLDRIMGDLLTLMDAAQD